MRLFFAHGYSPLVFVQGVEVLNWPSNSPDLNLWSSCESYFQGNPNFLCFVVLMQKNHCLISNTEHLVAKIRSVKFSFLLSIYVKYESSITYHSKAMANVKVFADKQAEKRAGGQTGQPKTTCPNLSMQGHRKKWENSKMLVTSNFFFISK